MIWIIIGIAITMLMCAATIMDNHKLAKQVNALQRNDHDRWCREQEVAEKEAKAKAGMQDFKLRRADEIEKENVELRHKMVMLERSDILSFDGVRYLRHQYRARKLKGKTIITIIDTK